SFGSLFNRSASRSPDTPPPASAGRAQSTAFSQCTAHPPRVSTCAAGRASRRGACRLAPRRVVLHRQPGAVLPAALDALLNEIHPFNAVVDIRVNRVAAFDLLAL